MPYGRVKRQTQALWSRDVKEGAKERRKIFAVAHTSKFTSMLLDMPRLSLLKPRLKHGRRHARLSQF